MVHCDFVIPLSVHDVMRNKYYYYYLGKIHSFAYITVLASFIKLMQQTTQKIISLETSTFFVDFIFTFF